MYTETNLHVTFCDIEGGDTGVGETAGNSPTEHALGVVAGIVGDGAKVAGDSEVSTPRAASDTSTRTGHPTFLRARRQPLGYYLEVVRR